MFKNNACFQVVLVAACFLPVTNLSADVLSTVVTSDLIEPEDTYDNGSQNVINMKVKTVIGTGDCSPDVNDGCTLNDVLNDTDGSDDFTPEIKVHMTADNFPDDGLVTNAELRQRGGTSRGAPQKSFRVKLDSSDDLWRGERRIQLIKSFWDFTRIRNKLSYDLMKDIPNLPSMRTQFVNLEIENEETSEDYGLYTQVEYFGKEYLLRRGWDDDSGVYKAEYFNFQDDPAFELDANGEPVDEDAFEELLEIKRGDDHTKLVEMIKAVNNSDLDFKTEVFEKYFNQDNYLSWLATNILLGNADTNFHNYYLYNPKDTSKFYLVPWDYDLIGGDSENVEERIAKARRSSLSLANWWFVGLHRRFLQQPGNLELLKTAVLELKTKHFSNDTIQDKLDSYYDVVFPRTTASPDIDYTYLDGNSNAERIETYNRMYFNLVNIVDENYQLFLDRIGDPMAFWMYGTSQDSDGFLTLNWGSAASLIGAEIKYELVIATRGDFAPETILKTVEELDATKYTLQWTYPTGSYFYRVIARNVDDPDEFFQIGSNEVRLENGDVSFGAREFEAIQSSSGVFPSALPDVVSTPNDTPITIDVLANDLGDGLVLVSSNPWSQEGGSVELVGNRISYTAKSDFVGEDKLWYVFKDSLERSNFGEVTINVTEPDGGEDVQPDGNPDTASATTGETITIDVLANDLGNNLTLLAPNDWSLESGRVELVNNQLSYTSADDFAGVDKIWYTFNDSQGRSDFGEVTINVVGPRPDGTPDNVSATTGETITIDVLANDQGAGLTLIAPNIWSLEGGSVELVDNQLSYTSADDFAGTDKIWYDFTDSQGRGDYGTVTITVTED